MKLGFLIGAENTSLTDFRRYFTDFERFEDYNAIFQAKDRIRPETND